MDALSWVSIALGAGWALAAATLLLGRRRGAPGCAAVAAVQIAAGIWDPLAPLVLAAWLGLAAGLPDLRWSPPRRWLLAAATLAAAGWAAVLGADGGRSYSVAFAVIACAAAALGTVLAYLRCRNADAEGRRRIQWVAAGGILSVGFAIICATLHVLVDIPADLWPWLVAGAIAVPTGFGVGASTRSRLAAERAVVHAVTATGIAGLLAVVYLVFVLGIVGAPNGHERGTLVASLVAAVCVALLAAPVRARLADTAAGLLGAREPSTEEAASTFSARMSRAVPMDELLLQLAESLQATAPGSVAEIWTGTDGVLSRSVSVPSRPAARVELGERERIIVGQARITGSSWAAVWLPDLVEDGELRIVPVAHLGELLGLIVLRNVATLGEDEERSLVELGRQLGLALHNLRLDSALQASLEQLAERNRELQASRLRIVNASDSSRRAIERNLHDGAQQHLVALAVKLGIARQMIESDQVEGISGLLEDLRGDVQATITELRELAHGIYPPLLRDRGLGEALRAAAGRSPLPCTVSVELPGRYPEPVETAAYFVCLEAMQNAAKYAGAEACLTVRVSAEDGLLRAELSDDGAGFDPAQVAEGHGFLNMRDRLGAIGGTLEVASRPGQGATLRAAIPASAQAAVSETVSPTVPGAARPG